MDPSKQETVSRQSSILKPPKQRQPLQCVGSHPSSSESSPTVRVERRVSFAKNRRIREFEAEQGTVWDDTYEEHDSNSTKSNSSIGHDQQMIISVPCQDKENFPIQLFIPTEKLGCTEVTNSDPGISENQVVLHESQMEDSTDLQLDPRLVNNDNLTYPNATIYCNDGMDETNLVPSEIIPRSNEDDSNTRHCTYPPLSTTDKGVSVVVEENLPSAALVSNEEKTQYFCDKSMNVTETIPVQQNIFVIINQCPKSDLQDEMNKQIDAQSSGSASIPVMNSTVSVENVELPSAPDKTRIFSYNSMNVTETIPIQGFRNIVQEKNFSTINPPANHEDPNSASQLGNILDGVTQIFQNASMDLTSRVLTLPPVMKSLSSCIKNSDMSSCKEDPRNNFRLDKEAITKNMSAAPSTTQIYLDESMELTSGVPILQPNLKNQPAKACVNNKENTIEKMKITCNDQNHSSIDQDKSEYMDKSMSMTIAVRGIKDFQGGPQSEEMFSKCGKTQIYLDDSMELTSGLPLLHPYCKPSSESESNSTSRNDDENEDDQDNICINPVRNCVNSTVTDGRKQELSQDLIGKVRHVSDESSIELASKKFGTLSNGISSGENPLEKDDSRTVFPSTSTSRVPSENSIKLTSSIIKPVTNIAVISTKTNSDNVSKIDNVTDIIPITQSICTNSENSIYTSKSMCMTMPVPSHRNFENMSHVTNLMGGKTQIFQNMSMDMTSRVSTMPTVTKPTSSDVDSRLNQSNNDLDNVYCKLPDFIQRKSQISSVTQIYQDESMELTSGFAISHPKNRDLPSTLDLDNMQRKVNSVAKLTPPTQYSQLNDSEEQKSRVGLASEMLASSKKSVLVGPQSNHSYTGMTQIFQNTSMDLTSKLPIQPTITKPASICSEEGRARCIDASPHESHSSIKRRSKSPNFYQRQDIQNESTYFPPSLSMSRSNCGALAQSNLNVKKRVMNEVLETVSPKLHHDVNNQEISNVISFRVTESTLNRQNRRDEAQSTNLRDGMTQIFNGESMDFTSRVCTYPTLVKSISTFAGNENPGRMDRSFAKNSGTDEKEPLHRSPISGIVQIDQDDSMEFTSGLPSLPYCSADKMIGYSRTMSSESRSSQTEPHNSQAAVNNSHTSLADIVNRFKSSHHQSLYDCSRSLATDLPDANANSSTPRIVNTPRRFNESNNLNNLSNYIPLQSSLNGTSPMISGSNHESFSQFGIEDKPFHRITSDELNTLCASMNLPNQRFDRTENTTTSHSIIPSCNDIQVLRDSLEKNKIFQQNSLASSNIYPKTNEISRSLEKTSKINDQTNDFAFHHATDPENVSITAPKNPSLIADSSKLSESFTGTPLIPNHHSKTLHFQNMEIDESPDERNLEQAKNIGNSSERSCESPKTPKQHSEYSLRFRNQCASSSKNSLHAIDTSNAAENVEMNSKGIPEICALKDSTSSKLIASTMSSLIRENSINETAKILGSILDKQYTQFRNETERSEMSATKSISCKRQSDSEVQVYHDSMNAEDSPTSTTKRRKSCGSEIHPETHDPLPNSTDIQAILNKENVPFSRENSLTRIPSDNTDTLIATMGFKTELSYPLIINEKTVIKISSKCTMNRTGAGNSDASCENQIEVSKTRSINVNPNLGCINQSGCSTDVKETVLGDRSVSNAEVSRSSFGKSAIANTPKQHEAGEENVDEKVITGEVRSVDDQLLEQTEIIVDRDDTLVLETNGKLNSNPNECDVRDGGPSSEKMDSFSGQPSEDLEEIQPPSFLCADSSFEDPHDQEEEDHRGICSLTRDVRTTVGSPCANLNKTDESPKNVETPIEKSRESSRESNSFENIEDGCRISTELDTSKKLDEDTFEFQEAEADEPLTPFQSSVENIKMRELRDDCIWSIREMTAKVIAVDYIAKSFVVIIRLNEFEKECIKDIDKIEFKSRLRDDCKNVLMRIVHDLLLTKMTSSEFGQYKLYEDILPLLDFISGEVISAMNFMFDLDRLNALNLMDIKRDRLQFTVSSKRANIILKISLALKVFNEIGPDDIDVTRILGNIRESDIRRLVVNVKKDYKFLSRYIKDIKDYATLIEETISFNKQ